MAKKSITKTHFIAGSAIKLQPPIVPEEVIFDQQIAPGIYTPSKPVSEKTAQALRGLPISCVGLSINGQWHTEMTPEELDRFRSMSRNTIAERGAFVSLVKVLNDWFNSPLDKLPPELRRHVDGVHNGVWSAMWDRQDATQRHRVAEGHDYRHDPALEEQRDIDWDRQHAGWSYWQQVPRLTAQEFCILRHKHDPRKFEKERDGVPGGEGKTLGERVSDDMRIIARTQSDQNQLSLAKWIALAEELGWVVPPYMRAAVGTEDAADAHGQHPKPVTARTIENAFIIPNAVDSNAWWRRRMGNAKRYGLDECRASRGNGKTPSLWYPDRIAGWLSKKHLTKKHAANILRKHFPECADIADLLDPLKEG